MPELPELFQMARFVNTVADGFVFTKIWLSEVARQSGRYEAVEPPGASSSSFLVSAESRGKEMRLHLRPSGSELEPSAKRARTGRTTSVSRGSDVWVLVRAGMSGNWMLAENEAAVNKHAHLNMLREDGRVLSFVDPRRFGSWHVSSEPVWDDARGPCPVTEHAEFRQHIRNSLDDRTFDKRICEVLLDQRYFNGVGNYLRAEILHRAQVSPFVPAREAVKTSLQAERGVPLPCDTTGPSAAAAALPPPAQPQPQRGTKRRRSAADVLEAPKEARRAETDAREADEAGRLLRLCYVVPKEAIDHGFLYMDEEGTPELLGRSSEQTFGDWLRCYGKPHMSAVRDSTGRTLWFDGKKAKAPGSMTPVKQRPASSRASGATTAGAASFPPPPAKRRRVSAPLPVVAKVEARAAAKSTAKNTATATGTRRPRVVLRDGDRDTGSGGGSGGGGGSNSSSSSSSSSLGAGTVLRRSARISAKHSNAS